MSHSFIYWLHSHNHELASYWTCHFIFKYNNACINRQHSLYFLCCEDSLFLERRYSLGKMPLTLYLVNHFQSSGSDCLLEGYSFKENIKAYWWWPMVYGSMLVLCPHCSSCLLLNKYSDYEYCTFKKTCAFHYCFINSLFFP